MNLENVVSKPTFEEWLEEFYKWHAAHHMTRIEEIKSWYTDTSPLREDYDKGHTAFGSSLDLFQEEMSIAEPA